MTSVAAPTACIGLPTMDGALLLELLLVAVSCCFVGVGGTMRFHVQDLLHALQVEEPLLPLFESELFLVV